VSRTLRLGTRGSALALLQAERVAGRLRREGIGVELVEIATTGDRDLALSVDELPSEAPFTDDIEAALRAGTIDIAVHCMKDLPLDPAEDLATAAVVDRADPREALVSRNDQKLATLAPGARVGTSGLLRTLQVRRLRPDLEAVPIRGTVEERVRLVRQGRFEATVLAAAGLERLGLEAEIAERFPVETFVPAPGQGAIAVQVRAGDERALRVAASIDDPKAHRAAAAERWLQRVFEPSRERSLAAHAIAGEVIELFARLLHADGRLAHDVRVRGLRPERVADEAARRLVSLGPAGTSVASPSADAAAR
jgi:hydroxymethylbilane synthase